MDKFFRVIYIFIIVTLLACILTFKNIHSFPINPVLFINKIGFNIEGKIGEPSNGVKINLPAGNRRLVFMGSYRPESIQQLTNCDLKIINFGLFKIVTISHKTWPQDDYYLVLVPPTSTPPQWDEFRSYAVKSGLSKDFFDKHFQYYGLNNNGNDVVYKFKIPDKDGQMQSSEYEHQDIRYWKPLQVPPKEVNAIITKKAAIVLAKEKGTVCGQYGFDFESPYLEQNMVLMWHESDYAWLMSGDNGFCFIDAETGNVEGGPYISF